MTSSGIKVADECGQLFQDMKQAKKDTERPKYASFKITKEEDGGDGKATSVVKIDKVEKGSGNQEEDIEALRSYLTEDQPLFVLFDFEFVTQNGATKEVLVLLKWCSDNAPIKSKMTFASTADAVKKSFNLDNKKHIFQITELSELDAAAIEKELRG